MDSNQIPAPLRITNLSSVPIQFCQSETREELTYLRSFIQPHQSMDYAWDEPTLQEMITCSVVGGTTEKYDLRKFGDGENLYYENHIYLAFEQTFNEKRINEFQSNVKSRSINDRNSFNFLEQRELVIDYLGDKLVLARREENKRSQLWRMRSDGILIHTGSSVPRDWNNKHDTSDDIRQSFVLDTDEVSNKNSIHINSHRRLVIRRFDHKRSSTQTWIFHNNGYLCMRGTQMCVQVSGDLKENSEVILGPCHFNTDGIGFSPLPNMHIRPRRRLKGSGALSVQTYADGPTRVLKINDINASHSSDNSKSITSKKTSIMTTINHMIYDLELRLECGFGISIVNSMAHQSEELVFIVFNDIHLAYHDENDEQSIVSTIGTIAISDQLLMTSTGCLLYAPNIEQTFIQPSVYVKAIVQKSNTNYKQV